MTTKNRLTKLEKAIPAKVEIKRMDLSAWNRSMETLADALTEIVGAPLTRAECEKALQELTHDN